MRSRSSRRSGLGQARVEDGDALAEAGAEAAERLRGERDLGDEDDRAEPARERRPHRRGGRPPSSRFRSRRGAGESVRLSSERRGDPGERRRLRLARRRRGLLRREVLLTLPPPALPAAARGSRARRARARAPASSRSSRRARARGRRAAAGTAPRTRSTATGSTSGGASSSSPTTTPAPCAPCRSGTETTAPFSSPSPRYVNGRARARASRRAADEASGRTRQPAARSSPGTMAGWLRALGRRLPRDDLLPRVSDRRVPAGDEGAADARRPRGGHARRLPRVGRRDAEATRGRRPGRARRAQGGDPHARRAARSRSGSSAGTGSSSGC